MADDPTKLRAKLKRYRYLHRMVDDVALRKVLAEEIAELERALAPYGLEEPDRD